MQHVEGGVGERAGALTRYAAIESALVVFGVVDGAGAASMVHALLHALLLQVLRARGLPLDGAAAVDAEQPHRLRHSVGLVPAHVDAASERQQELVHDFLLCGGVVLVEADARPETANKNTNISA